MSRLEELKEDIAFEKQIFFILFAAALGMVGWLFTRGVEAEPLHVYVAVGATVSDCLALAFLARRVKNKIRELRSL